MTNSVRQSESHGGTGNLHAARRGQPRRVVAGGLALVLAGLGVLCGTTPALAATTGYSLDANFNAALGNGFNGFVSTVVPVDGGYLVGGNFSSLRGVPVGKLVRLDEDLNLDTDLNAVLRYAWYDNNIVKSVIPVDGGYLLGGEISSFQDVPVGGLMRLDENLLNMDTDFNASLGAGFNGSVGSLVPLDGGYLVGGWFTSYQGVPVGRVVRLDEDLNLDTSFDAALGSGFNNFVYDVVPVDGGYLVGGDFTSFRGVPVGRVVRLVSVTVTAGQVADRSDVQGVEVVPQALSVDVSPVGVAGPVEFSVTGLPSGLSLDAESGQLTGTPTTPGTYTVQVTATVPGGVADSTSFDWTIQQAVVAPSITGVAVDGVVGQAFSFVPVLGGDPDPTVTSVGLPDWANLDPSTGAVTGTPTEPGSVSFTLTASNGVGPDATLDVVFEIAAAPVVAGQVWAELEHAGRTPGQTQSVVGGGFVPGDRVGVVMNSRTVDLGMALVDGQGRVALSFVVPEDAEAGPHTVTLTGTNGTASATFTVTAAPGTPGPSNTGEDSDQGALAQTGAGTLATVTLAVLVILLGTTLTRTTRVRHHTHS